MGFGNYLRFIDMFGEPIVLRINNEERSKTLFGGIMTFLLVGLLGTMFWFDAKDIFYHLSPNIILEDQTLTIHPEMNITTLNMPFAICLQDMAQNIITKPRFVIFETFLVKVQNDPIKTSSTNATYPHIKCTPQDFPNIDNATFFSLGVNNMLCTKSQNWTIAGYYDGLFVQFVKFRMRMCRNSTEGNCAPRSEIENFIKNEQHVWNVYFQNNQVNTQNFSQPLNTYILNLYKMPKVNITKNYDLFIKYQQLESDDGFIQESKNYYNTLAYDTEKVDESDMGWDEVLVDINIFSSSLNTVYHRSYKKIQSCLANVGGLAKVFMIAIRLTTYLFSITARDESILNKIFDFDFSDIELFQSKSFRMSGTIPVKKIRLSELGISNKKVSTQEQRKSTVNHRYINNYMDNNVNVNDELSKQNSGMGLNSFNVMNPLPTVKSNYGHLNSKNNILTNNMMKKPSSIIQDSNTKRRNSKLVGLDPRLTEGKLAKQKSFFENNKLRENKSIIELLKDRKKRKNITFNFWEILKMNICKFGMNEKLIAKSILYKKSVKALDDYLDITYIIQKLEEFEKIKFVIFNEEQIALFNFIAKSICSSDVERHNKSEINRLKDFVNDKDQLARIIVDFKNKMKNKEEESLKSMDRKLFGLLSEEFREGIE